MKAIEKSFGQWRALPDWIQDSYNKGNLLFMNNGVQIKTLEGTMTGQMNDWIICGVSGEIYPCKPGIFEMTYEKVSENE